MKYIDADLLRKEIEHRIDILSDVSIKCAKNDDMEMHNYYHGKAISLNELLSFIDSLQQEQDLIVINKKDWEAQEQFRKNKDFGKTLQQKQPEEPVSDDLEEELENYYGSIPDDEDKINAARHFAEWQKAKMMEGAVEGFVTYGSKGAYVESDWLGTYDVEVFGPNGSKVKIIIVKEDGQ